MSIHYTIRGTGFPIVMIHGWTIDHQALLYAMEPIFEKCVGWKRIYLDLPGMGQSASDDSIRNSDDILNAVVNLLDSVIPNEPFLVCGNSYGGYIARGLAHVRPEFVRGMLLIAPMTVPDASSRVLPEKQVLKKDPELLARLGLQDAASFESMAVIQGQKEWERYRDELLIPSQNTDFKYLDSIRQNGYGFSFDMDTDLSPFQYPALIITGKQDHVVGYQDAWRLYNRYPRATFAVLDMAGHNLHIEQQEVFEVLVKNWLDRLNS